MYPNDQQWGQPASAPPAPGYGPPPGWGQPASPPPGWGAPAPQQPPASPAVTPPSADDFLTGGHRSGKFETFGQVIGGEIVEKPRIEQQTDPKTRVAQFYPSGDPKWVMLVAVQAQGADGDDDGVRTLYVKADLKRAVQKAIAAAGAERLEVGGVLQARYVRDEPNSSGSGLPKKVYEARYIPPAAGGPVDKPVDQAAVQEAVGQLARVHASSPVLNKSGGRQAAIDEEPPF